MVRTSKRAAKQWPGGESRNLSRNMTMKGRKGQVGVGKNEGEGPEGKSVIQWKAEERGQEQKWEAGGENEDGPWREFVLAGCDVLAQCNPRSRCTRGWEGACALVLHNQTWCLLQRGY